MKTRNGFLFQFVFIFALTLTASTQVLATPLDPINIFDYMARLNQLRYTPLDLSTAKISSSKMMKNCQIDEVHFTVRDPLLNSSHEMTIALYHPTANGRYPAIIIVPTIIGRSVIETSSAYRFCLNNMVTAIADVNDLSAPAVLPDWQLHDRNNRGVVIDLRNLIDLLQNYNQVNPQKIGAYGLSLGAFSVALLASVDSRLSMVALVAGAGNMPAILSYSTQSVPTRLRNMRMTALNDYNVVDYENNLRSNVRFDPIYMTKNPNPKKYFMLMDVADTEVPAVNQHELWEALGEPAHLDVSMTHAETIISAATIHFDDILKNIVSRFEQ